MTKTCARCEAVKSHEEFYASKTNRDGRKSWCKDCARTYLREWHQADPTRRKRYASKYADQTKKQYQEWYRANRETKLARHRLWAVANQDKIRVYVLANRQTYNEYARARYAKSGKPLPVHLVMARMAYWGYRCWMCGGPFEHVDHVKPIAAGGPNIPANLRPACAPCNQRKSQTWPYPAKN